MQKQERTAPNIVIAKSTQSHLPPCCTSLNSRAQATANAHHNEASTANGVMRATKKPPIRWYNLLLCNNQSIKFIVYV